MSRDTYLKRTGLCSVVPSFVPVGLDSPCLRSRQRASPTWLCEWSVGLFYRSLLKGRDDAAPGLATNCCTGCSAELLWC